LNPGHERDPDAVTKLDPIEAEVLDLAQHFVPGRMPSGVPAGGEGDHGGNDEARMTNDERNPNTRMTKEHAETLLGDSYFVITSAFVIRASPFLRSHHSRRFRFRHRSFGAFTNRSPRCGQHHHG